jgi:hypothetical protein
MPYFFISLSAKTFSLYRKPPAGLLLVLLLLPFQRYDHRQFCLIGQLFAHVAVRSGFMVVEQLVRGERALPLYRTEFQKPRAE